MHPIYSEQSLQTRLLSQCGRFYSLEWDISIVPNYHVTGEYHRTMPAYIHQNNLLIVPELPSLYTSEICNAIIFCTVKRKEYFVETSNAIVSHF